MSGRSCPAYLWVRHMTYREAVSENSTAETEDACEKPLGHFAFAARMNDLALHLHAG